MPENAPASPGTPTSPGHMLRNWGRAHPTLVSLRTLLPSYPSERPNGLGSGLYLDAVRTPWVAVRGEIRVSLARLISVGPDGKHHLIGQVQVTAVESDVDSSITLRFYIHQPAGVIAREVGEESEWWLSVLDAHYRLGGAPVHSDAGVAA